MSAIHQPSPIVPSQNMLPSPISQNGIRPVAAGGQGENPAVLALLPMNGTFERKQITVPFFPEVLRIGRQTNPTKTVPTPVNGYFDSKVLSRQHAEVWADRNGKIWIRDVKSSNGTFVNGVRLSPENRDSEPHELREHDTLELGIDIVSEDQKSIVHHKVSAKVEHAGIYTNGTNVLDLNFGDIDPTNGGGLMGPPLNQQMAQNRARTGSAGSIGSNGRLSGPAIIAGSNLSAINQQRQMNYWLSPITIEQVVKKLTSELKQAKQQSQDLHRTSEFFGALLTQQPGDKVPKPTSDRSAEEPQINGHPVPPKLDPRSPFSQPPAPPPQQPLPEKPDAARANQQDSFIQPSLKRTATEKSTLPMSSPTKPESSSQILSLVEALTSAKKEIDSQGDRVKQLEDLLRQERKARESAEERARRLEIHQPSHVGGDGTTDKPRKWPDSDEKHPQQWKDRSAPTDVADGEATDGSSTAAAAAGPDHPPPPQSPEDLHNETVAVDASTSRLQQKLDLMLAEMDEMKAHMERYKRRAEVAEEESAVARKTLAEMVESIRAGERRRGGGGSGDGNVRSPIPDAASPTAPSDANADAAGQSVVQEVTAVFRSSGLPDGIKLDHADAELLHRAVGMALERRQSGERAEGRVRVAGGVGAPYASMIGVVLIGVGIMTWLNGWSKGER
ncbi:SMAD/FHA domain [Lasallia pustulata]|uniref:SMAD/FHA domain n=1 Tax=Lasallia pustulata TaxID=136370 RepID=A0A1W5CUP0_9LECA|nr:SMAD/FHA domain [Lasallia pustulata]